MSRGNPPTVFPHKGFATATPAGWEDEALGGLTTLQDESCSFDGGALGCEAGDLSGLRWGVEGATNRAPTHAGALS
jgi:hypothetical protein